MTRLPQPTTCLTYWRHAVACYMHYGSCAVMASLILRFMMSFVQLSLRSWPTAYHHRLVCVLLLTVFESFVGRCKWLQQWNANIQWSYWRNWRYSVTLFSQIMTSQEHVLQPLLPDRHSIPHSLRDRTHNKTLLNKSTHLNNDDFLIRMFYKGSYLRLVLIILQCSIPVLFIYVLCSSCIWQLRNKWMYDNIWWCQ